MTVQVDEENSLAQYVASRIKTTVNKFRENPEYFFTESDLHSYCYMKLFSSDLEIRLESKRNQFLVHREYPTNFRYSKEALFFPDYMEEDLDSGTGSRGHYDLVVVSPEFAKTASYVEVRNKDIAELRARRDRGADTSSELLFAIEFKYMIRDNANYIAEVIKDNHKLRMAKRLQAKHAINLVFCDGDFSHTEKVRSATKNASDEIISILSLIHI